MKLKQHPSDFIVEELTTLQVSDEPQAHRVYQFEKQGLDTFDAIRLLAKKLKIPLFEIGYAGLKDKHSSSRQLVSIPAHFNVQTMKNHNFSLQPLGYISKKIHIGDLLGNRFTIMVRDVKEQELDDVMKRAATIPSCGVPNYFDSQRFGSFIHGVFIAKLLMKKQYEQAVKQYLTAYQKSELKSIKNEKRRILSQWAYLDSLHIVNKTFAGIIQEYRTTKDWCAAYKKIPAHLREIFMNAYQSYLWNESVKQLLKKQVEKKKLYPVEYAAGSLLFYTDLSDAEKKSLPETFLTMSDTAQFTDTEQSIVTSVLKKENITLNDFASLSVTGNFFKSRPRNILVFPEEFTVSEPQKDEINNKSNAPRLKIQASFSLPKGSYATIVTKRLFGH